MTQQLTFDERFAKMTPSAIAALTLAEVEAHQHNQKYIGTEHLLMGMLRQGSGLGTTILSNLGLDLSLLGITLEEMIRKAGPSVGLPGEVGITPRAKQTIEFAVEEARAFGHGYIGQEHLLLGFMREGDGIAPRVLLERGVTLERLRAEVIRLQSLIKSSTATSAPKNNVVTFRLTDDDVQALDDLVEAGVRSTRSDAAAWLVHVGIEASSQLLATVRDTVAEIRRLREQAQSLAQQFTSGEHAAETAPAAPAEPSA